MPQNIISVLMYHCHKILDLIYESVAYILSVVKVKLTAQNDILQNIPPCSPVLVHRRFGGIHYLHLQDRRINETRSRRQTELPLTMKTEIVRSSETSVNFHQTTRLHFPKELTRHRQSRDNNTELVLSSFLQHKLHSNLITRNNLEPHTVGNLTDTSISHSLSI
jgi:hypothetical protein